MNALMKWIEKYLLPVAGRIGSQKHLVALRDAFIGVLPATMAGSIAVLLNAFVRDFPTEMGLTGFVSAMQPIIAINGLVWQATLAILAVIFSFSLGYQLAKIYDVDPLSGGVVSLAAFFVGLPATATASVTLTEALPQNIISAITEAGGTITEVAEGAKISLGAWGFFDFGTYMGGRGLFAAIIFGFISTIIFSKLMLRKITIKLPDSVPPAVSKAFAAIIPGLVGIYAVAILCYIVEKITGKFFVDLISELIQAPLLKLSQGYGAVLIIVLLVHILWFFGLHGTNILGPVLQSVYGTTMNANMLAFESGEALPYKWTSGSFDAFSWLGGAGVTLALVIGLLFVSKREDHKAVGKLGIGPAIFNINEPVMFGLPIVLNPIFFIPYILAPIVSTTIAYVATVVGFMNPTRVNVLWIMPPILSGFLATGLDWRAIIVGIVCLAASFGIYLPFVMAANRMEEKND
ncbi:permease IIC component [Clostridia bacterium]|nr:permease IIC component [Clostridia bacterium]